MTQTTDTESTSAKPLQIGWASNDITPPRQPVLIAGQFHARVSEGVDDPLSTTALALASGEEKVVFVSCDVATISDDLRDRVRKILRDREPQLCPDKVILHATHTHAGPQIRLNKPNGVELDTTPIEEYLEFLAERVVKTVLSAWQGRKPGKIAYGSDCAVVGRNRRWVDRDGASTMYNLKSFESRERFRHIEGYEDHSLNLLATYDADDKLTGLLVNVPSPSQESEHAYRLSADFWCETREELRRNLGEKVFVLPQCSAAGDQTSHLIFENAAHERMLKLRKRSARREIACRISEAVLRTLPAIKSTAESHPELIHQCSHLELPVNLIDPAAAQESREQADVWEKRYQDEMKKVDNDPSIREQPHWYVPATKAFRKCSWHRRVTERHEAQERGEGLSQTAEVHVIRLGEVAFASNPFEYYLDYGIQIKVRSPFIQTFLIQLAGSGTYVPSPRSVEGGGYGSVPASNPVGPEGGQMLAEQTIGILRSLIPAQGVESGDPAPAKP